MSFDRATLARRAPIPLRLIVGYGFKARGFLSSAGGRCIRGRPEWPRSFSAGVWETRNRVCSSLSGVSGDIACRRSRTFRDRQLALP